MVDLIERLRNRAEQTSDYPNETLYSEAADELTALRERVAELEGALRPFANALGLSDVRNDRTGKPHSPREYVRHEDFLSARAILAKQGGDDA